VIFNSFVFLGFFVVVYIAYRALGRLHRAQNRLLLLASYVFYGYWDWRFLSLIAISTVVDYYCGIAMRERAEKARSFLTFSMVTNLGLLFTFKYFDFFQDSFVELLNALSIPAHPVTLNIVLPVGISFYTFQTMSYTIDVYRKKLEPCRDFLDFALFVSFFPQLVAGPIERAVNLLPQIVRPRKVTAAQTYEGLWLITWGYFKKVYVADNVAMLVDASFGPAGTGTGAEALVAVYAFAVQIYCDFSGYTDIARGLAKLLGIELMLNFNLPYFAKNPSDFWRRWHISLSTWLRDYLYIGLGGNRGGTFRTYRNLFLTMLLGGLWHGAAWTYVAWGVFHGGLLISYRLIPSGVFNGLRLGKWGDVLAVVIMFHFTCIGWLLFRAESIAQAWHMFASVFTDFGWSAQASQMFNTVLSFSAILLIVQLIQYFKDDLLFVFRLPIPVRGAIAGALVYFILIHGAVSDAFIYFQF
jgi:D-alanyl-lipoteichoic acid acyltransferase DltB (MBOAT superfamily)